MRTRRHFTAEFKARVALEAIRGERTLAELAAIHQLHVNLVMTWKRQAVENLTDVFARKAGSNNAKANYITEIAKLHAMIGKLLVERDALAKACQARDR